jgi:hypothetical protein
MLFLVHRGHVNLVELDIVQTNLSIAAIEPKAQGETGVCCIIDKLFTTIYYRQDCHYHPHTYLCR